MIHGILFVGPSCLVGESLSCRRVQALDTLKRVHRSTATAELSSKPSQ